MKEKILIVLKIIGGFLWVIGGGMVISAIFIGLPIAILILFGLVNLELIFEYVPEIIIVVVVFALLLYGFTKKVPNPYQ